MFFSIFFKLIFLGILSTREGAFSVPTGHSRVKFDIKRPRLNVNLQSLGSRREKGPDENVYLSPPSSDYGRDNNGKREDCFAALSPTSPIRVVDKLLENPAYEMESVLGEGSFGVVYRAKRTRDGSTVCVKKMSKRKISKSHLDPRSGEINEVFILRLCHHPNIIKYLDYFEGVGDIFLVLEHVSDSEDLFFFIEHNSPLREEASKTIFHQIAWALHYLHHCGITHGDIKDENILINKNDGRVKLIDFGSSFITSHRRMAENGHRRYFFAGTIQYASPEITSGHGGQGPESDIFACGLVLQNLMLGIKFKDISDDLKVLLYWMLHRNPRSRINIDQVLTHPWVSKNVFEQANREITTSSE